jgi:hypothetical protein
MIYVALLRGVNVGGKNKVDMNELKAVVEQAGMTSVSTYINSGNVVFSSRVRSRSTLAARLEKAAAVHFGFDIKVLVRDLEDMRAVASAIPPDWVNDSTMKCDVMFFVGRCRSPQHPRGADDQARDRRGALCARRGDLESRPRRGHEERHDEAGRHAAVPADDHPQLQHGAQAARSHGTRFMTSRELSGSG